MTRATGTNSNGGDDESPRRRAPLGDRTNDLAASGSAADESPLPRMKPKPRSSPLYQDNPLFGSSSKSSEPEVVLAAAGPAVAGPAASPVAARPPLISFTAATGYAGGDGGGGGRTFRYAVLAAFCCFGVLCGGFLGAGGAVVYLSAADGQIDGPDQTEPPLVAAAAMVAANTTAPAAPAAPAAAGNATDAAFAAEAERPECGGAVDGETVLIASACAAFMCLMFFGLAVVCEEFFVPALNLLCEKAGLPDDVAGATFMAAGASSPELFASLVGVLSGSSVGAGTVVGSELFNMLVIVGAVGLLSGPAGLQLDWRILVREAGFFGASLAAILIVLSDGEVQTIEAIVLLCCYGLYALTCAFYGNIVRCLPCCAMASPQEEADGDSAVWAAIYEPDGGPPSQHEVAELDGAPRLLLPVLPSYRNSIVHTNSSSTAADDSLRTRRIRTLSAVPDQALDGKIFGMNYGRCQMHGFLFVKTRHLSKIRMAANKWKRRWLVLLSDGRLCFVLDDRNAADMSAEYSSEKCLREIVAGPAVWPQCSVRRLSPTEFAIDRTSPKNNPKPVTVATMKAQSPAMASQWFRRIQQMVETYSSMQQPAYSAIEQWDVSEPEGGDSPDTEHHSIIAMPPASAGCARKIMHMVALPLLLCFHLTVPDVRKSKFAKYFPVTMFMAIVWLALLADGMMMAAEQIACVLAVPEDLMGLTVTAAGTSLPNLFGSMIVAKQGLGNMAVSNAFGSNTFNIFVALALPWLVGTMLAGNDGVLVVPKGKIYASCLLLVAALILQLGSLIASKMRLTRGLGKGLLGLYAASLVYLVATA